MVRDLIICGLAALEVEEEGKAVRKYVIKRPFHYEVGIPIKNPKKRTFWDASKRWAHLPKKISVHS